MSDHPDHIGPYRILQVLGEGGMGVVYDAEQTTPVQRRVAIKVIRLGMDTKEVVARFEAERQALAVMDHPNIAKVLDAGTTDSGRPFFVMERVTGIPITDFCDEHRFDLARRIELFLPVCAAVQHAHQKGVIHRDLKPSNILVGFQDGVPTPKVIDFGIAKATHGRLTQQTLVTQLGMTMGTPVYMSPEQWDASGLDVDTRSDVYTLGVILYELLVGRPPRDPEVLERAGAGAGMLVRTTEPARPSGRVQGLGAERDLVAKFRGTDAVGHLRALKGDLDWIILKAIEHDRTRRYDTANALAMDLKRHLASELVTARPPSAGYRLRKFVRRNRALASAGTVAAAALVIGTIAALSGLTRARRAERAAAAEAAAAREVSSFLVDLFERARPGVSAAQLSAADLLARGRDRVRANVNDPVLRARLEHTLGEVYRRMGMYDDAADLLTAAVAARDSLLPPDDPELVASLIALGNLRFRQGRLDEALGLAERARGLRAAEHHPLDTLLATAEHLAGITQWRAGRDSSALAHFAAAEDVLVRLPAQGNERLASLLLNVGTLHASRGRYDQGEPYLRRALALMQPRHPDAHPDVVQILNNLGLLNKRLSRYADAERYLVRAMNATRLLYGDTSQLTSYPIDNLGALYVVMGRLAQADSLLHASLQIQQRAREPNQLDLSETLHQLGLLRAAQGRPGEAVTLYRQALAIREAALPAAHPDIAVTRRELADLLRTQGRNMEAETLETATARH